MEPHEFSKTAFIAAAYRARATASGMGICNDPWAERLAGEFGRELSFAYDQVMQDAELWVSLRTRHIDDCVSEAISDGTRQVVVLGAGLDTRAARMAADEVRFFEVDRPASQAAKRRKLASLPEYPVDAAIYVACDLQEDDFVKRLAGSGLDLAEPTCVVLEGVVYYVEPEAVRGTFRRIAQRLSVGSRVVFDHFDIGAPARTDEQEPLRYHGDMAVEFLSDVGERPIFSLEDPIRFLSECGLASVQSTSFADLARQHTGHYDPAMAFDRRWVTVASQAGQAFCVET